MIGGTDRESEIKVEYKRIEFGGQKRREGKRIGRAEAI